MIFSSGLFLLYFLPFFLLIYYIVDKRYRLPVTVIASIFFYAWGSPAFIFILLGSIIIDHYLVVWMLQHEGKTRKRILALTIIYNILLLLYFKYANFFIDNVNVALTSAGIKSISWTKIALPVGISFIVFQKICYALDVNRKLHPPASSLLAYAYYILMFPKLLAGPIVRFRDMNAGIENPPEKISYDSRLSGFYRFSIGLAKKVLIANVIGAQADVIFALNGDELTTALAWTGALAYAFQIYFDFSGYSDMAIGLAGMMGFRFPENFNNPYISGSITEFWKRWHMTLSSWLRDYVFLPDAYASSRRLKNDHYFGLKAEQWIYMEATMITMFVCGFWHGAAWTFILWGLFQGMMMVLERLFLLKFYKKTGRYLAVPFTFLLILLGWVIFRSGSYSSGFAFIHRMFSHVSHPTEVYLETKFWTMICIAAVFSFWGFFRGIEKWQMKVYSAEHSQVSFLGQTLIAIVLFIISLSAITSSGFSPFIYFRF
jgi:alginate O-acetyltransferase complex protein AlgI